MCWIRGGVNGAGEAKREMGSDPFHGETQSRRHVGQPNSLNATFSNPNLHSCGHLMVARTGLQNSLIAASLKCSPAYRKGSTTNFMLCKNNGNTPANGVGGMHLG